MNTLLIVDDDESIRLLMRDEFCDRDYNVITAIDGEEALVTFNEAEVDLVILDMNIPKLNGAQVFKHLNEKSPETPVIIFTANPDMVYDIGDIDKLQVVYKSSDLDELIKKVDVILDA